MSKTKSKPKAPAATTRPPTKPPGMRTKLAAREAAQASAERVANMPRAELRSRLAKLNRALAAYAPSPEAATSDALAVVQAAVVEFARAYYPDAVAATVFVRGPGGSDGYTVSLPVSFAAAKAGGAS